MKKRILALLMAGVLALSTLLVGCGNEDGKSKNDKNAASQDEGPWYKVQYHDFTLGENEWLYNVSLCGNDMYYIVSEYNEEASTTTYKAAKMSLSDYSVTEIPLELEKDFYVMAMYVNENGIYLATQMTKWDANYTKLEKAEYKIVHNDLEGNLINTFDITDEMKSKGDDTYPAYMSSMVSDKDGNVIISDNEKFILAYDKDGNKIADISNEGRGNDLIVAEDGTIYYSYMDEADWTQVFAPVDVAGIKLGERIGALNTYNSSNYYVDADQKVWTTEDNTLKTYDLATGESTKIVSWLDYDINGDNIRFVRKLEDGKILAYLESYEEDKTVYELVILEESDEPVNDKVILTYATFGTDSEVTDAIIRFNKNNDTYRIKVVDYYDDEDYEAGLNAYNEAILNGEMADIISVDWSQYKSFARKGLYADLNDLMDKDADINREDYFANVLEAYEVDGKLYAMPTSFAVSTLVGKTSVWGSESGITVSEIADVMDTLPADVQLVDYMSKSYWLYLALQGSIENFVDWETGECSFESEEFITILEMANKFPAEYDYEGDTTSTPEKIQTGKILLYGDSYYDITGYQVTKAIFNEEVTAVGYPGVGGNGGLIQNVGGCFAIAADSENKEGAWEFVKYMISEEYQCNYINWYNPIHKAAFEEQMEQAATVDTYIDENGEEVESSKMTYGWDDFEVSVYHATEEDIAEYKAILEGATTLASYEEDILTMIQEEVEPFFEGQKTAQDVAKIIQGRVKIYVNENR